MEDNIYYDKIIYFLLNLRFTNFNFNTFTTVPITYKTVYSLTKSNYKSQNKLQPCH